MAKVKEDLENFMSIYRGDAESVKEDSESITDSESIRDGSESAMMEDSDSTIEDAESIIEDSESIIEYFYNTLHLGKDRDDSRKSSKSISSCGESKR